jgi:hypothetical protein
MFDSSSVASSSSCPALLKRREGKEEQSYTNEIREVSFIVS